MRYKMKRVIQKIICITLCSFMLAGLTDWSVLKVEASSVPLSFCKDCGRRTGWCTNTSRSGYETDESSAAYCTICRLSGCLNMQHLDRMALTSSYKLACPSVASSSNSSCSEAEGKYASGCYCYECDTLAYNCNNPSRTTHVMGCNAHVHSSWRLLSTMYCTWCCTTADKCSNKDGHSVLQWVSSIPKQGTPTISMKSVTHIINGTDIGSSHILISVPVKVDNVPAGGNAWYSKNGGGWLSLGSASSISTGFHKYDGSVFKATDSDSLTVTVAITESSQAPSGGGASTIVAEKTIQVTLKPAGSKPNPADTNSDLLNPVYVFDPNQLNNPNPNLPISSNGAQAGQTTIGVGQRGSIIYPTMSLPAFIKEKMNGNNCTENYIDGADKKVEVLHVYPEFHSDPDRIKAYAEIRANECRNEDWDVLAGIPSTENLFVAAGGQMWAADYSMTFNTQKNILRTINIIGRVQNYMGANNDPCTLKCTGHSYKVVHTCKCEAKAETSSSSPDTKSCGTCGKEITANPKQKFKDDPDHPGQKLPDGWETVTASFSTTYTGTCTYNCSTGMWSKSGNLDWTIPGKADLDEYNQAYNQNIPDISWKCPHSGCNASGTVSAESSPQATKTIEDDYHSITKTLNGASGNAHGGYTLSGTYGCACEPKVNAMHRAPHAVTCVIYEYIDEIYYLNLVEYSVYGMDKITLTKADSTVFEQSGPNSPIGMTAATTGMSYTFDVDGDGGFYQQKRYLKDHTLEKPDPETGKYMGEGNGRLAFTMLPGASFTDPNDKDGVYSTWSGRLQFGNDGNDALLAQGEGWYDQYIDLARWQVGNTILLLEADFDATCLYNGSHYIDPYNPKTCNKYLVIEPCRDNRNKTGTGGKWAPTDQLANAAQEYLGWNLKGDCATGGSNGAQNLSGMPSGYECSADDQCYAMINAFVYWANGGQVGYRYAVMVMSDALTWAYMSTSDVSHQNVVGALYCVDYGGTDQCGQSTNGNSKEGVGVPIFSHGFSPTKKWNLYCHYGPKTNVTIKGHKYGDYSCNYSDPEAFIQQNKGVSFMSLNFFDNPDDTVINPGYIGSPTVDADGLKYTNLKDTSLVLQDNKNVFTRCAQIVTFMQCYAFWTKGLSADGSTGDIGGSIKDNKTGDYFRIFGSVGWNNPWLGFSHGGWTHFYGRPESVWPYKCQPYSYCMCTRYMSDEPINVSIESSAYGATWKFARYVQYRDDVLAIDPGAIITGSHYENDHAVESDYKNKDFTTIWPYFEGYYEDHYYPAKDVNGNTYTCKFVKNDDQEGPKFPYVDKKELTWELTDHPYQNCNSYGSMLVLSNIKTKDTGKTAETDVHVVPNGVYTQPVSVLMEYSEWIKKDTDKKVGCPPLTRPFRNKCNGIFGKDNPWVFYCDYYEGYSNVKYESKPDPSKYYDYGLINDIVIHNPVSTQYCSVVSNEKDWSSLGVKDRNGNPFIPHTTGQDDRKRTPDETQIIKADGSLWDIDQDYWIAGNEIVVFWSDVGDFYDAEYVNKVQKQQSETTGMAMTNVLSQIRGSGFLNDIASVYDVGSGKFKTGHANIPGPGGTLFNDDDDSLSRLRRVTNKYFGYLNSMDTTIWTAHKYVVLPCPVMYVSKSEGNKYKTVPAGTKIDLLDFADSELTEVKYEEASGAEGMRFEYLNSEDHTVESHNMGLSSKYGNREDIYTPPEREVPGFYAKMFLVTSMDEADIAEVQFIAEAKNHDACVANGWEVEYDASNPLKDTPANKVTAALSTNAERGTLVYNNYLWTDIDMLRDWPAGSDAAQWIRLANVAPSLAVKCDDVALVGRIGNPSIADVGDFRWATYFKGASTTEHTAAGTPAGGINIEDWRVITSIRNIWKKGTLADYNFNNNLSVNALAWNSGKSVANNTFPLKPSLNPIPEFRKEAVRPGYSLYMDIETIGNYFGNGTKDSLNNSSEQNLRITPTYVYVDKRTGKWYPIDIYYRKDDQLVPWWIFNKARTDVKSDEDYGYYLNFPEEEARRGFNAQLLSPTYGESYEKFCQEVIRTMYPNDSDGPEQYVTDYIGSPDQLVLDSRNRTFIGSSVINGHIKRVGMGDVDANGQVDEVMAQVKFQNSWGAQGINDMVQSKKNYAADPNYATKFDGASLQQVADGLNEASFIRHGQRWYYTLGLPSTAIVVPAGTPYNPIDISKANDELLDSYDGNGAILMLLDFEATGEVWTLKYDAKQDFDNADLREDPTDPEEPDPIRINKDPDPDPDPPIKELLDKDPTPPPSIDDKIPVVIFDPRYTAADDFGIIGTH